MTIRRRLTLLYTGLLAVALSLFSVGLFVTIRYSLLQQVDRQLLARYDEVRGEILLELARRSGISDETLEELLSEEEEPVLSAPRVFVELIDPESRTVYRSSDLGSLGTMDGQGSWEGENITWHVVQVQGERVRLLTAPVRLPGQGFLVVRVGQSLAPIDRTLEWLGLLLVLGTVLTTIVAGWAGSRMASRALAPIASMIERARTIVETQDLDTRLPVINPDDEVGQLAVTFNEALDQITLLFQAQRRFVADAAHELRTPLTSIRGHTDLLRRGAAEEPEAREEALSVIDSEAERLTRLVNDLLLLAQSEATPLEIMHEPVPLVTVVADVLRQERLLAPNHEWHFDRRANPVILGDSDRLHQLCINLFDNARRHTPEGSQIEVIVDCEDDFAVLTVADTGPGIPEEQLPHLFEPFFRGDRNRRQEGAGLGLAIVARIAAAHGGTVTAANRETGGAIFTVHLPLIPFEEED